MRYNLLGNAHYRGVAQLIARSVWDREVEGLSPFTPTKKRSVHLGGFFLAFVRRDSNFRLFVEHKSSRSFGETNEVIQSSETILYYE